MTPRRIALFGGVVLLALLPLTVPVGGSWLVRTQVLPKLSKRLGRGVTARSVRVGFGRASLRGFTVDGAGAAPPLVVPQVRVRYSLSALLSVGAWRSKRWCSIIRASRAGARRGRRGQLSARSWSGCSAPREAGSGTGGARACTWRGCAWCTARRRSPTPGWARGSSPASTLTFSPTGRGESRWAAPSCARRPARVWRPARCASRLHALGTGGRASCPTSRSTADRLRPSAAWRSPTSPARCAPIPKSRIASSSTCTAATAVGAGAQLWKRRPAGSAAPPRRECSAARRPLSALAARLRCWRAGRFRTPPTRRSPRSSTSPTRPAWSASPARRTSMV